MTLTIGVGADSPPFAAVEEGNLVIPRSVERLELADLRYAKYQRELDDIWMRRIQVEFDPRLVRRPWVSRRDGVYWLVDGQHTVGALIQLGVEYCECEVLAGLTYEQEARLHEALQRLRKAPTMYDSFNALIEAGDEEVTALREACRRQGFAIVPKSAKTGNTIAAVGALWKVWQACSRESVEVGLKAMRAWHDLDRTIPGYVLAGVCRFVNDVDDAHFDEERLKAVLASNSPRRIELKVSDFGPQGTSSSSRLLRARDVLLNMYNKGLSGDERAFLKPVGHR